MKKIAIYGASGHGLVVADIAKACSYENIIFIDDGDNAYLCFDEIKSEKSIAIALGVGDNKIRKKLFDKVKSKGYEIVTLIHPDAIISENVSIGEGTVVMPNVVVNSNAIIDEGAILNTGCIVEHECHIGKFVHISPNCALAGNVEIGEFTHIGIGSNIIQGITIGNNAIIGAGSTVVQNIGDCKKAYGTPCREIEDI